MGARERIVSAGATVLAMSPDGEIAVRELCEAAEVTPATVNQYFGDRVGLLTAIIEHSFGEYLEATATLPDHLDPVEELTYRWDAHLEFARRQPTQYRAMFAPGVLASETVLARIHEQLLDSLDRCAAQRRLAVPREDAARLIASSCVGVALSMLSADPAAPDPAVANRLRDTVLATVTGPVSRPAA